ncbi:MAG: alpha-N-acetylglucosaminidase, partial [Tannerellaceae bacterium]
LNLPKKLVRPTAIERKTINGKYRVNFNYCTISYTAPWWDWKRWEREIDFMAMNSINTPLQTIGLDAVWYHTLLDMGFTDNEARSFLVTPAHQAWQWMPNIESIGGGLPLSWIESHKDLARKIYARQVELGMQPIQQAFTGYVPKLLKDKYPDAKIAQQPEWYGFEGVSQLDPLDPLFKTMGDKFMENQKKLFGNYGMYAADPFHESTPPDNSDAYLEKVGAVIYNVIKESDPNAMVAMQSWSIRKPILEQFPKDSIIVLCLNGGRNDFWGYNFIAGNLHNFGGRINMHGDLNLVASNQYVDAVNKTPNAIGSGLFMESIVQNPVYYALAYEMPLYEGAIDCKEWLDAYTERAYGAKSENAQKAWHILLESAYGKGTNGVEYSSVIAARPAINVKKSGPNAGFKIPYDEQALYKAQALLLADANKLGKSKLYRFDIVDVQRQIMTNLAQRINKAATAAYKAGDLKTFRLHRDRFLELLLDTDKMLASRTEWNFDKWVNDARSWGTTSKEKDQLEEDATSLVTFWGFTEGYNCIQFDYSWREWAGLIRRYYYPRWKKLYDVMETSLAKGEPYNDDNAKQNHGREAFRGNEFYSDLADWEIAFSKTPKTDINPHPKGDEVKLAKQMFEKYSKINTLYLQDSAANSAISTDGNFEYKN